MRRYEKKTTRKTTNELVECCCDLCGESTNECFGWEASNWDVNETKIKIEISHKEGEAYPEGGHSETSFVDICPDCFKDKLIPWLKSEGAEISTKELDW